ncbi:MAG: hypothetical protein ACREGA_04190 [Candidatus Saccharimonadales bacterium]
MNGQDKPDFSGDEASAKHSEQNFAEHAAAYKSPKKGGRRWLKPVLAAPVIIILLVLAGGIYWLVGRHNNKPVQPHAATSNQPVANPAANSSNSSSAGQYVSNGQDLNLTFTKPAGWTVTPASNNNSSDQTITLNSPVTSLTSASGGSVTGKVTLSIRPKSSSISELSADKAETAQKSAQFGYSQPAKDQYRYPYLTFINLNGGADPSGQFQEVMITGVKHFAKGSAITSASLTGLDPIISARFYKCSTQACSGSATAPLGITNATWQNAATAQQALAIFKSLKLN